MGNQLLAHEDSHSRVARVLAGMRYEKGGQAKYWIPKPGQPLDSRTPLLSGSSRRSSVSNDIDPFRIDREDEQLYARARELEFGDWNYPVIPANDIPPEAGMGRRKRRHTISKKRDRVPSARPSLTQLMREAQRHDSSRRTHLRDGRATPSSSRPGSSRSAVPSRRVETPPLDRANSPTPSTSRRKPRNAEKGKAVSPTPGHRRPRQGSSLRPPKSPLANPLDHPDRSGEKRAPTPSPAHSPMTSTPFPPPPPQRQTEPASRPNLTVPGDSAAATNTNDHTLTTPFQHTQAETTQPPPDESDSDSPYPKYNFASYAEERNVWD
ncbi:hypothetical protein KEM55_000631 [Ascosphaera atra]|nr:hypothetical protein KEM55_000631 [Ascosphaera atra]